MENKDYNNYDYIEIIVKTESEREVVSAYSSFLWQETHRQEDNRYADVTHVFFKREHRIENKDRLQLLQVHYESVLNEKSQAFEQKCNKTKALLSNVILLIVASLFLCFYLVFAIKQTWSVILGLLLVVIVGVLSIFAVKYFKTRFTLDEQKYLDKATEFEGQIKDIMQEVRLLTGGEKYEK